MLESKGDIALAMYRLVTLGEWGSANITVLTTCRIVQLMIIVMPTTEPSNANHMVMNGSL